MIAAYKQIQKYFDNNFEYVELKYEADPEFEAEGLFFIVIRTKLPLAEARVILNKFNDDWFLNEDMQMLNSIFTVIVRPYDF